MPMPEPLRASAVAALPRLTRFALRTECGGGGGGGLLPEATGQMSWMPLPLALPEGSLGALEACAAHVTACALRLQASSPTSGLPMHDTHACTSKCMAPPSEPLGPAPQLRSEIVDVTVALPGSQLPLLSGLAALQRLELRLLEDADEHAVHAVPALQATAQHVAGAGLGHAASGGGRRLGGPETGEQEESGAFCRRLCHTHACAPVVVQRCRMWASSPGTRSLSPRCIHSCVSGNKRACVRVPPSAQTRKCMACIARACRTASPCSR